MTNDLKMVIITVLIFLFVQQPLAQAAVQLGKVEPNLKAPANGTEVSLALVGYNYTNRYINEFSVHGISGGNLFVSSPRGGGGGEVCCVPFVVGARAWTVPVRWQVDACKYGERMDSDGEPLFMLHSFFKDADVMMDGNIAADPRYFEVHFYPDGHIEIAVTSEASSPRLLLNPDRQDRSKARRCPLNVKPSTEPDRN